MHTSDTSTIESNEAQMQSTFPVDFPPFYVEQPMTSSTSLSLHAADDLTADPALVDMEMDIIATAAVPTSVDPSSNTASIGSIIGQRNSG